MSMWAFDKFKYTEDADVQVLGLPYEQDSTFSMYIFLPRVKFALKNVERELTGRRLLYLIARSKIVDVEVEHFKIIKMSFFSGSNICDLLSALNNCPKNCILNGKLRSGRLLGHSEERERLEPSLWSICGYCFLRCARTLPRSSMRRPRQCSGLLEFALWWYLAHWEGLILNAVWLSLGTDTNQCQPQQCTHDYQGKIIQRYHVGSSGRAAFGKWLHIDNAGDSHWSSWHFKDSIRLSIIAIPRRMHNSL